jgi:hypothetical protein
VLQHPAYNKDSLVSEDIAYDLLAMINKLESGEAGSAEVREKLLGSK